eukprot:c24923_g1_i1 orf=562-2301(-)
MKIRTKKRGEFIWPRSLMKKLLNLKSRGDEFSADEQEDTESEFEDEGANLDIEKPSCSNFCHSTSRFYDTAERPGNGPTTLRRGQSEILPTQYIETEEFRVFVGTWNVAGKSPPPDLELNEWLEMEDPVDIYVLGFQEVIPLNASNVLGTENCGPGTKWQALIRQTLNKANQNNYKSHSAPPSPCREEIAEALDILLEDPEEEPEHIVIEETTNVLPPEGLQLPPQESEQLSIADEPERVYSRAERIGVTWSHQRTESDMTGWVSKVARAVTFSDDSGSMEEEPLLTPLLSPFSKACRSKSVHRKRLRYVRIASKQMVGIHISVWVRRKLRRHIHNLTVSCVGIGLMGYLGNKGSVSISMSLYQTSFCFICTHLTSGEKEGDELRRNADVMEILKRTHFPPSKSAGIDLPETIFAHDRIIWFGDLNYRLNLADNDVRMLVAREEWEILLQKDQLRKELSQGCIFDGWLEGQIYFAPTYKYEVNSNQYFGENAKSGEKRRAPAWCDRILWYGKGLRMLSYMRAELRLSDHRPVHAVFLAQVEGFSEHKLKKALTFKNAKVEVEELLSQMQNEVRFCKVRI